MAFVNEWPSGNVEEARTVDYERGAVLKCEGGLGRSPGDQLCLSWRNLNIKFYGHYSTTEEPKQLSGIDWEISTIRIPVSLKNQTEEIKKMIAEAMEVYGHFYRREGISRLTVTLPENVMYYNDQLQQQAQR